MIAGQKLTIHGAGGDLQFLPFDVHHGHIDALGFRIGPVAYTPDVHDIPAGSLAALEDLDVWIVDALRHKKHVSHFNLEDALMWIEWMQPKKGILTNLHHDMDYSDLCQTLPDHIRPAYDGLEIEI